MADQVEFKGGSWSEWANYVLAEIKRLSALADKVAIMEKDISILQLKAGVWSLIGGSIVAIGTAIMWIVARK